MLSYKDGPLIASEDNILFSLLFHEIRDNSESYSVLRRVHFKVELLGGVSGEFRFELLWLEYREVLRHCFVDFFTEVPQKIGECIPKAAFKKYRIILKSS